MGLRTDVYVYRGDSWETLGGTSGIPQLRYHTEAGASPVSVIFGMDGGATNRALAVDQLDQLLVVLATLRNGLAVRLGVPTVDLVTLSPVIPDDDEDDDEPAAVPVDTCPSWRPGAAGSGPGHRCGRELGHPGAHFDTGVSGAHPVQWYDWSDAVTA